MLKSKLEEITINDIKSLIENKVCENRNLEYKKELHIDNDKNKKEFLADISSFANSYGGDIIFGIEEDNEEKIPCNMNGIEFENEDTLIRSVEELIRQSIQPKILNIRCKVLDLQNGRCILIIRIPRSTIAPHRIIFKNSNRFFARNSMNKYEMDVTDLREAFNSGLSLERRIEEYTENRYYEIECNKYNKLIDGMPVFVVHYIPEESLNSGADKFSIHEMKKHLRTINADAFGYGYSWQVTINGVKMEHKENNKSAYAIYKDNGIIEKATTVFFRKNYKFTEVSPNITLNYLHGNFLVDKLIEDYEDVKKYYSYIGIETPIIIKCAIINGEGYTIPTHDFFDILGKIDRDIIYIDSVLVEDLDEKAENVLKPIFDSIWNSCGYERCTKYDENGEFRR